MMVITTTEQLDQAFANFIATGAPAAEKAIQSFLLDTSQPCDRCGGAAPPNQDLPLGGADLGGRLCNRCAAPYRPEIHPDYADTCFN